MEIVNLYPGSFGSNCYCLISGNEAAIIDPSADAETILKTLSKKQAELKYILLTHGHFDHMFSMDELRDATGATVLLHERDADFPMDADLNAFAFFFEKSCTWRPADKKLQEGMSLPLGDTALRVIHTPGHTGGSVCFLCDGVLFTGDTLFDGNVGRYDLPGGDREKLRASIQTLRTLPPTLRIYPGHGPDAILGQALERLRF